MQYAEGYILSQAGATEGSITGLGLGQFLQTFVSFRQMIMLGSLGLLVLVVILIPVYYSQHKRERTSRASEVGKSVAK